LFPRQLQGCHWIQLLLSAAKKKTYADAVQSLLDAVDAMMGTNLL
jgi:hypothetical protein